jgi:hypothetical protein
MQFYQDVKGIEFVDNIELIKFIVQDSLVQLLQLAHGKRFG